MMLLVIRKNDLYSITTLCKRAEQKSIAEHVEPPGGWATTWKELIRFLSCQPGTLIWCYVGHKLTGTRLLKTGKTSLGWMSKRLHRFRLFLYKAGITVCHFPKAAEPQWLRFRASPNPTSFLRDALELLWKVINFPTAWRCTWIWSWQADLDKPVFQNPVCKRKSNTSMIKHELNTKNTTL